MKWPFKKKEPKKGALDDPITTRAAGLWCEIDDSLSEDEISKIKEIVIIDEKRIQNLGNLVEIEERMKPQHWWNKINPNTVLVLLGNAALTILITKHEDLNVITSKAKQFWVNLKP